MSRQTHSFDEFINTLSFKPISKGLGFKDPWLLNTETTKPQKKDSNEIHWNPNFTPKFLDPEHPSKSSQSTGKPQGVKKRRSFSSRKKSLIAKTSTSSPNKSKNKKVVVRSPKKPVAQAAAHYHNATFLARSFAFLFDFSIVSGFFVVSVVALTTYLKYSSGSSLFPFTLMEPLFSVETLQHNLGLILFDPLAIVLLSFGACLSTIYKLFFTFSLGATPGKLFFNLIVIDYEGKPASIRSLLHHSFVFMISIPSALFAMFSRDRETWYDRAARVRVVRTHEPELN